MFPFGQPNEPISRPVWLNLVYSTCMVHRRPIRTPLSLQVNYITDNCSPQPTTTKTTGIPMAPRSFFRNTHHIKSLVSAPSVRPRYFSALVTLLDHQPDLQRPPPPSHTAPPNPPVTPKPRKKNPSQSPLRVWPFVVIFAGGVWAFKELVNSRTGRVPHKESPGPRPF
jgi:hypothetical protein